LRLLVSSKNNLKRKSVKDFEIQNVTVETL